MLKNKINRKTAAKEVVDELGSKEQKRPKTQESEVSTPGANDTTTSNLFVKPFWQRFYDLECQLNDELKPLPPSKPITHTYNPVEYAAAVHCAYLRRFADGPKRLMFIGMNPGPNGMGQTGVPFGNISTVRDVMRLSGEVHQPPITHTKRPVHGLQHNIEEPSGVRIWSLFQNLAGGSLDTFRQQCFLHNFCPLAFFDKDGKNITPNMLKGDYKTQVREKCLHTTDELISLMQPEIVVAIGEYVHSCLLKSTHKDVVQILRLPHPSPRSLNNQNWPEKAADLMEQLNLLRYIRNEM